MVWTLVWSKDTPSPQLSATEMAPQEPDAQETELPEDVAVADGEESNSDGGPGLTDADLQTLLSSRMFDDLDDPKGTQGLPETDPYPTVESPVQAPKVT